MRENRQQCVGWHVNNNVIKTKYRYFVSSNNLQKKKQHWTIDKLLRALQYYLAKKSPLHILKKTFKNH